MVAKAASSMAVWRLLKSFTCSKAANCSSASSCASLCPSLLSPDSTCAIPRGSRLTAWACCRPAWHRWLISAATRCRSAGCSCRCCCGSRAGSRRKASVTCRALRNGACCCCCCWLLVESPPPVAAAADFTTLLLPAGVLLMTGGLVGLLLGRVTPPAEGEGCCTGWSAVRLADSRLAETGTLSVGTGCLRRCLRDAGGGVCPCCCCCCCGCGCSGSMACCWVCCCC